MKAIKNINIKYSLNVGKDDILYNDVDEIIEHFPNISAKQALLIDRSYDGNGYVKGSEFTKAYPTFVSVTEWDTYVIL